MSSTYRIFIQDVRVATAVALDSGEFFQVYPVKQTYPDQESWASDVFWANRATNPRSYTLGLPDGSRLTYLAEKYKLFHDGKCVSVGIRVGHAHMQRYPYVACGTRLQLISERAPLFGVETTLYVKVKDPVVTPAPEPVAKAPRISWQQRLGLGKWSSQTQGVKDKVSRWAIMSPEQRQAWKDRMALAKQVAKERRAAYHAQRSSQAKFISVGDLISGVTQKPEYYGEEDFVKMHPSLAAIFRTLSKDGPIRKSHEGCECGNC